MTLQTGRGDPFDPSAITNCDFTHDVQDFQLQASFLPTYSELPLAAMSVSALADHCCSEGDNYRRGDPSDDRYGVELFNRALTQRDPLAWEVVQQSFSETVLRWMHSHPLRKFACCFDSEENYVAQAFTRFWQATVNNQEIRFRTLAAALRYLHACLHGTILDTLRAYSRPQEVSLPGPGEPGEPLAKDHDDSSELWEVVQSLLPDEREQRAAYLFLHCNLKPREIIHFCSQEFSDVQVIYRLRRNIFERLLRNADTLRWRLDDKF